MCRAARLAAAIAIAIAAAPLGAAPAAAEDPYKITVQSIDTAAYPEIRIVASVTDAQGRAVKGLAPADIEVIQGSLVQTATVELASQTAPVALVVALDTSGSLSGRPFADAKNAIISLLQTLGPADEAALVTFSAQARTTRAFTADKPAVIGATNAAVAAGDTALYDAIAMSTELLAGAAPQFRRALIVLTDGFDTASRASDRADA
ncbi:MAG: VWA domain-containing protein, partial [Candidatus Limnocylindria bacterium]